MVVSRKSLLDMNFRRVSYMVLGIDIQAGAPAVEKM
jgi:hypothetical protein